MSEVKVNKITPTAACGTVTLGDSGDTFSIPSGVTLDLQGSSSGILDIQWDTTAKTSAFTAVAGNGYFVNTTSAAITVTLPASPSAGDFVAIKDYANTADTNNITVARNGSKIQGTANDFIIETEGLSIALIYVDATQGWLSTGAAQASDITFPTFITATGGTITTDGDYKIHTFTAPGTFCVSSIGNPSGGPNTIDYTVVAGGAGGGGGNCGFNGHAGGGGGAGGYRESSGNTGCYTASPLATPTGITVTATGYPVTVGGGGAGGTNTARGSQGSNSVFSTITSSGGGFGGGSSTPVVPANSGGSGGGGGTSGFSAGARGCGNSPPVSPSQGTNGGPASPQQAGGGGGATDAGNSGGDYPTGPVGLGGDGATTSITGSAVARAGGGGGGSQGSNVPAPIRACGVAGGTGGGGLGGIPESGKPDAERAGGAGTVNTGGGGGGGGTQSNGTGSGCVSGGAGGSGVVIIRYKYQ